ncbi:MAG: DDE-type integrase/transposase/recombinase [Eubacteriales bacterium]
MKDHKKADEIAADRVQMLAPILAAGADAGKTTEAKLKICQQYGISDRTLRRYLEQYRKHGFEGLRPKSRERKHTPPAIPENVMEQAVLLRREVPSRSVSQIIRILEWEGLVAPGQLKRSTLQERLAAGGYSTRHMKMYAGGGIATRRYQHRYRNQLWHSDIKYGPYLPIGPDGALKQVFLVVFIDDATRFVLHGQFYPTLDQVIIEDAFRQAIHKYAIPETVFFDNGKQYRTRWMNRACAKMGIRLLYAKPYSPESTGKIERFNRVVDSFLSEAALEKPKSLDALNTLFWVWLEECYQHKPHSALINDMSPETAYRSDSKALKYIEPEMLATAFLHCEERKVDKAGCISFQGRKYEVGVSFIGCKVEVTYDPANISELTIEYPGHTPWQARELVIGERTGPRPKLPEHLAPITAESSRLLQGAARQHEERRSRQLPAVSYRNVGKAGEQNV